MLESIHVQIHIVHIEKITVTTTDNESNFMKAFREFGPSMASANNSTQLYRNRLMKLKMSANSTMKSLIWYLSQ